MQAMFLSLGAIQHTRRDSLWSCVQDGTSDFIEYSGLLRKLPYTFYFRKNFRVHIETQLRAHVLHHFIAMTRKSFTLVFSKLQISGNKFYTPRPGSLPVQSILQLWSYFMERAIAMHLEN
jgi:hypothetical protein